jgi:hypothetical protein
LDNDVRKAAFEAIKLYNEQQKTERKRTILHNTEEILKHYLALTDSIESIETESLFIKSFTESRTVTEALIKHVNRCLDKLEERYPAEFDTLVYLYMDEDLVKINWNERKARTSERMHISIWTVERWRKDMVGELSVLLFGGEGLKLWTI